MERRYDVTRGFWVNHVAALLYCVAFKLDMDFADYLSCLPLSDDSIMLKVSEDNSEIIVTCHGKYDTVLTIEHDTVKSTAIVKVHDKAITILADDADLYELECFLEDNRVFHEFMVYKGMYCLKRWFAAKTDETGISDPAKLYYENLRTNSGDRSFRLSVMADVQTAIEKCPYDYEY